MAFSSRILDRFQKETTDSMNKLWGKKSDALAKLFMFFCGWSSECTSSEEECNQKLGGKSYLLAFDVMEAILIFYHH